MRFPRIAPIILAVLAASSTVRAQQFDIATDNELLAAYCIGALQADYNTRAEQAKIQGFRSYLAARGAFTAYRSPMASQGLNVAVERGHADGMACNRTEQRCTDRCLAAAEGSREQAANCSISCEASACQGPARCSSASPLPF